MKTGKKYKNLEVGQLFLRLSSQIETTLLVLIYFFSNL